MPVLVEKNNIEINERSECIFIHVQNLPWTAGRLDVEEFFNGITVKKGGIIIRNSDAFVELENSQDVSFALNKSKELLHGCNVKLDFLNESEVRRALFYIACRKLNFDIPKKEVTEMQSGARQPRKIRPTPVLKGEKALSCSIFLPKEELLPPRPVPDKSCFRRYKVDKSFICERKKMTPTIVTDRAEGGNFSIFHPEVYSEVKEIKMDV